MQKTAATPIDLARVTAAKLAGLNEALVLLDLVLYENWRSVEGYVARVLEPFVTDWKTPIKSSMSRPLMRALPDHVDLLDFSEAFLRLSGAPMPLIDTVTRIMQNDIELTEGSKMASTELEQKWGRTLHQAASQRQAVAYSLASQMEALNSAYTTALGQVELKAQKGFQMMLAKANAALAKAGYKLAFDTNPMMSYVHFRGGRQEGQLYLLDNEPNTTDDHHDIAEIVEKVLGVSWYFQKSSRPHQFVTTME